MIGTECLLSYCQRPFVQRLGIGITTLGVIKVSQIVQRLRNIGMIGTEGFFSYRQRPLVQRLGIGITTLGVIKISQIVQRLSQHRDDRDQGLFRVLPVTACTTVRRRRSDLESSKAPPDCSVSRNIGMIGTKSLFSYS